MAAISAVQSGDPVLPLPPRDVAQSELEEASLTFPLFTANTAWTLGSLLRSKLQAFARPAIVDISLAQNGHCLFHCATHPGTTPDNDAWVARKRNAVLRFGCSTWSLQHRVPAGMHFSEKFHLGTAADQYAVHGGGWPIKVKGVEGVVAVVVVSGLKQEQDHAIIVQAVSEMLEEMGIEVEKKKED